MTTIITMTPKAVKHFKKHITPIKSWLRVAVKPSGCSGYEYDIVLCDKSEPTDVCEQHHGLDVCIEKRSCAMLLGMTIDHQSLTAGQEKIVFNNPQAKDYCGCGVSFSLKGESDDIAAQ